VTTSIDQREASGQTKKTAPLAMHIHRLVWGYSRFIARETKLGIVLVGCFPYSILTDSLCTERRVIAAKAREIRSLETHPSDLSPKLSFT
jgi:hypothetical protein